MVLVDTPAWVSRLREMHTDLAGLLNDGDVLCHPFIVGELAYGNLKNKTTIFSLLEDLPMVAAAEHEEVLAFIESYNLMGRGLGYVDVHLLVSALLTGVTLWTLDKKLNKAAEELHCRHKLKTRYPGVEPDRGPFGPLRPTSMLDDTRGERYESSN